MSACAKLIPKLSITRSTVSMFSEEVLIGNFQYLSRLQYSADIVIGARGFEHFSSGWYRSRFFCFLKCYGLWNMAYMLFLLFCLF